METAAVAPGFFMDFTYLMKGVFTQFVVAISSCFELNTLYAYLYIDGIQLVGDMLYLQVRPSLSLDTKRQLTPTFIDTYYNSYTFVFNGPISIDTSIRVRLNHPAAVVDPGTASLVVFAQEVI